VTNSDTSSYQPERLDKAAARVATSAQTVGEICAALSLAARIGPNSNSELIGPLEGVRDDLRAAVRDLSALGAELPKRADARGLDALTELVKAESTRSEAVPLLDALRRVLPFASALDDKHGRSCWADDLGDVIAKLELQIHGPSFAVTGGRE
jgi:hypothetical protein